LDGAQGPVVAHAQVSLGIEVLGLKGHTSFHITTLTFPSEGFLGASIFLDEASSSR
jgi:hypothetical protein